MSAEADAESESDPETEPEPEPKADDGPDQEAESKPEPEPESEKESESETTPDLTTDAGGFACKAPVDDLLEYFEQFTPLLDEIKLHLDTDGFRALGVDPANVGMIRDELDAAAFDHYSSTGGLIGLDLGRITDVLSIGDSGATASMELDQETRKLEIVIEGLEYTLALIDPDSIRKEPDIPDLDLPAAVEIEGKDLKRSITAAEMVSDHIRLETGQTDDGEDAFIVSAEGDTDDVELELTRDELIDLEMAEADSLFSLDYLMDLAKEIPNKAEVRLEIGEEFPVFLTFEHIEGDETDEYHASVTQMVAPRIQSD